MTESLKNQIKEHLLKEAKSVFRHEWLNCAICNPTFTIELTDTELEAVKEWTTKEDWQSGIPDGKNYEIDLNNYYLFVSEGLISERKEIEDYDEAKNEGEAEIQEEENKQAIADDMSEDE